MAILYIIMSDCNINRPKNHNHDERYYTKDQTKRLLEKNVANGVKGDKGDPGPRGIPGPRGEDGKDGPQGPQGLDGRQGVDGAQGVDGKPGESAYQIAVRLGYEGTEEEYALTRGGQFYDVEQW